MMAADICVDPERRKVVLVVMNRAETEYDGSFTGDVETTMMTITEEDLKATFHIELEKSLNVVDGESKSFKTLVKSLHARNRQPNHGPFSKVLAINIHNDGDADYDYGHERAYESE